MKNRIKTKKNTKFRRNILFLILFAFLSRAILPIDAPIFGDEALYAQELDEMVASKSLYTTYMGEYVPWKPPLMFWTYSVFSNILKPFNFSIEITYRIPSLFFGFLSVFVFYFLALELVKDENFALISSLIFSTMPILMVTNAMLMTDNLLIFLILLGITLYVKGEKNSRLFLLGGFFVSLSFLTKTVVSFMIPLFVIVYFYLKNKEKLKDKFFLTSLSAIPLTFLLTTLFFGGEFASQHIIDLGRVLINFKYPINFVLTIGIFLMMTLPWIPFLIFYIYKKIRKKKINNTDKLLLFWLLFFVPPFFSGSVLWWYFIPILPAISILIMKEIVRDGIDKITILLIFSLLIISIASSYLCVTTFGSDKIRIAQKEIGVFLSNKPNVLVFSYYSSGIIYYKFHNEKIPLFNSTKIVFTSESITGEDMTNELLIDLLINSIPPEKSTNYLKALYGAEFKEPFVIYGNFDAPNDYVVIDEIFDYLPKLDEIYDILNKNNYSLVYENRRYKVFKFGGI